MRFLILLTVFVTLLPSAAEQKAANHKQGRYVTGTTVTGGRITDGQDLYGIRHGVHPGMERVVLDIYHPEGPSSRACHFKVEPVDGGLRVTVNGVRKFSARFPKSSSGDVVTGYEKIVYEDDSGYQFLIKTDGSPAYEVFEMQSPGRIVIDLKR